jgi:hypothetical protein
MPVHSSDLRARAIAAVLLSSPLLVILLLTVDADARRAARRKDEPSLQAVAARLPSSDLALSGGARWLRMPSLEEPSAAFADGPALPDPDPAGGAMAPPIEVWRAADERRGREPK